MRIWTADFMDGNVVRQTDLQLKALKHTEFSSNAGYVCAIDVILE